MILTSPLDLRDCIKGHYAHASNPTLRTSVGFLLVISAHPICEHDDGGGGGRDLQPAGLMQQTLSFGEHRAGRRAARAECVLSDRNGSSQDDSRRMRTERAHLMDSSSVDGREMLERRRGRLLWRSDGCGGSVAVLLLANNSQRRDAPGGAFISTFMLPAESCRMPSREPRH
jgi:hypothetical protein